MNTMVTVLLLATAGCSADGTSDTGGPVSAEARPYVDALTTQFTLAGEGDFGLDDDRATCLANRWISILEPARLEGAGIEPTDFGVGPGDQSEAQLADVNLSDGEATEMVDAFGGCRIDLKAMTLDNLLGPLSDDERSCLDDAVSDDLIGDYFKAVFTVPSEDLDSDPASEDYVVATEPCIGKDDGD